MLGSDLVAVLRPRYEVCGLGTGANKHGQIPYQQVDISNQTAVIRAIRLAKPAVIIHTAAFTDVDGCELNPHRAFWTNVKGTEAIAQASHLVGATLFFLSTDYVFDGTKLSPYVEEDTPNPISVYGRSKYEAEEYLKSHANSVWIIRSSWLFGSNGRNFFRAILQKVSRGEKLRVVDDQKGAPTYTKDLASALGSLLEKGSRVQGYVIYHLANSGETTWFQAARKTLEQIDSKTVLEPISSRELKRPARRPANSVFNMTKINRNYGIKLRPWDEAFDVFWKETLKKEWENSTASQSR